MDGEKGQSGRWRVSPVGAALLAVVVIGVLVGLVGPRGAQAIAFLVAGIAVLMVLAGGLSGGGGLAGGGLTDRGLPERRADYGPEDRRLE